MMAGNFSILLMAAFAFVFVSQSVIGAKQNSTAINATAHANATVSRPARFVNEMLGDDSAQLLRSKRAPKGGGGGRGSLGSAVGQGVASGAAGVGASILGNAIFGGGR